MRQNLLSYKKQITGGRVAGNEQKTYECDALVAHALLAQTLLASFGGALAEG
jgi:hypothetical protein